MAITQAKMIRFSICKKGLIASEYTWGQFYWKGSSIGDLTVVALISQTDCHYIHAYSVLFEQPYSLLQAGKIEQFATAH